MSQPLIPIVRCLYNRGYCELDVSQECRDKYKELFLEDLPEEINCCRSNQNLIKVIHLLGVEACSGPRTALRIDWIPQEMEEYLIVNDYDGQETISIDYNEAYANVLHDLMKHNCECTRQTNYLMGEGWSDAAQCDCIPQDAREKYQRITYIREKMRGLPRRKINELPDTNVFIYEL